MIDDDEGIRGLLQIALARDARFGSIATASTAEEAVEVVTEFQPDGIVLDLALPGASGHGLLSRLRDASPGCRIVVFSGCVDERVAEAVLSAGAVAVLEKGRAAVREIIDALAPAPAGIRPGTVVEVQSTLDDRWSGGFSVTAADESGYWLQRADGSRLPAPVRTQRVRAWTPM